jgi:hypothetical protein
MHHQSSYAKPEEFPFEPYHDVPDIPVEAGILFPLSSPGGLHDNGRAPHQKSSFRKVYSGEQSDPAWLSLLLFFLYYSSQYEKCINKLTMMVHISTLIV